MTTIKAYTDLSQSKVLADILPLESADMYFEPSAGFRTEPSEVRIGDIKHAHPRSVPCWSLAALLSVLPYPSLHKTFSGWRCDSYNKEGTICKLGEPSDNPVDACYKMIIKLNELKNK